MYTSSTYVCHKKYTWRLKYLGLSLSASRINHDECLVQVKMKNQPRPLALKGLRYFALQSLGTRTVLPPPLLGLTARRQLSRQARRPRTNDPAGPCFLQRRQERTALKSVCRAEMVCCSHRGGPANNSPGEHPEICRHAGWPKKMSEERQRILTEEHIGRTHRMEKCKGVLQGIKDI